MAAAGAVAPTGEDGTFYGMLGETERRWLQQRGAVRIYHPGYLMMTEGEPSVYVMVLRHGFAAASCVTETGAQLLLRVHGPGDLVSGETVPGQQARTETVQALTRCSALVIPADKFAELLNSAAGVSRAFGIHMARRVQAADEQARTRLARPAIRLARALLDLADRTGTADGDAVTIPVDLPQETLAIWIAASRATVARELAALRRQGVIRTGYARITVTSPALLRDIAANFRQ